MTHIENLRGILDQGRICCDRQVRDKKLAKVDIGNPEIKLDRFGVPVPCGPAGVVADYVPFYFAPRSPMLFIISRGGVPSYTRGQTDVIYLMSSAQAVEAAGLKFVFSDGHARMAISEFYDDLAHLGEVDWDVMASKYWNDTQEFPDRKRRRQAEFLVHKFLPADQIEFVACRTHDVANNVNEIVESCGHATDVRVAQRWYF